MKLSLRACTAPAMSARVTGRPIQPRPWAMSVLTPSTTGVEMIGFTSLTRWRMS